jgi:hypothetical protein
MTMKKVVSRPVTLGLEPSFGFGDRIGLATPGHVDAMLRDGAGMKPIFAQQSIREMTRTGRTPAGVMADALRGMAEAGWSGVTGADADHLKTPQDVDRTAAAGFTFFVIDPSDQVDAGADDYDESTLRERFAAIRDQVGWFDLYLGQRIRLDTGTVLVLDEETTMRAAVKYGLALNRGIELSDYIRQVTEARGADHEIEFSIDESDQPTTLAEHYIIADQCLRRAMRLVSLAPRFVGRLEKGVDYIGAVAELERTLVDHQAIANQLGPYKLSLHSGSDKLSMYTVFARVTQGRFHVKTAGTSYLEALRVTALRDVRLFREICRFSRAHYDADKATYHVHAGLGDVPDPDQISDDRVLEKLYLERWSDVPEGRGFTMPGRQILHCTFGSVLTDARLGGELRGCLEMHRETYREVLAEHFGRHLRALRAGL